MLIQMEGSLDFGGFETQDEPPSPIALDSRGKRKFALSLKSHSSDSGMILKLRIAHFDATGRLSYLWKVQGFVRNNSVTPKASHASTG